MVQRYRKICQRVGWVCLLWIGLVAMAGCVTYQLPGGGGTGQQPGTLRAPTLSNLTVAPNPATAGSIVNLRTSYIDADGDLYYGVAAVAVNGAELSHISFRSNYTSGILTIPLPISYYTRPSDVQLTLRIRDSSGNWSNPLTTVLSIR